MHPLLAGVVVVVTLALLIFVLLWIYLLAWLALGGDLEMSLVKLTPA
jgi:hypothetical protein